MILNIYIDDKRYPIHVPKDILEEGESFFSKLDKDMDRGWKMSRYFVDHPDTIQRCQIVADRILTAMEMGHEKTLVLMAGYILSRLPGVHGVQVDVSGEMFNTEFLMEPPPGSELT